jgi:REP element-mobilizing transposase RayT
VSNVHRLKTSVKIFFITTNLNLGEQPFHEPEYQILAETMVNELRRLDFLLFGYVLMTDHWHALISPQSSVAISDVLQNVKRVSSFRINRLRQTDGSRWQHQFLDRFVRHAREFTERLEYMYMNPVRRGLIEKPEQWRWSSYNNFSLKPSVVAACPIQIDYVHLPDHYRT